MHRVLRPGEEFVFSQRHADPRVRPHMQMSPQWTFHHYGAAWNLQQPAAHYLQVTMLLDDCT